jgi:hypothetical protein
VVAHSRRYITTATKPAKASWWDQAAILSSRFGQSRLRNFVCQRVNDDFKSDAVTRRMKMGLVACRRVEVRACMKKTEEGGRREGEKERMLLSYRVL